MLSTAKTREDRSMQVEIDPVRCEGTGLCADLVPQVFELVGDPPVRLRQADVPPSLVEVVCDAVTMCPTAAISVRDK